MPSSRNRIISWYIPLVVWNISYTSCLVLITELKMFLFQFFPLALLSAFSAFTWPWSGALPDFPFFIISSILSSFYLCYVSCALGFFAFNNSPSSNNSLKYPINIFYEEQIFLLWSFSFLPPAFSNTIQFVFSVIPFKLPKIITFWLKLSICSNNLSTRFIDPWYLELHETSWPLTLAFTNPHPNSFQHKGTWKASGFVYPIWINIKTSHFFQLDSGTSKFQKN